MDRPETDPSGSDRQARWIYVTSSARSGSTLLGMLLERGLGGFDCGELVYLWAARAKGWSCECGELVARCDLWAAVADEVRRDVDPGTDRDAAERMRALIVPPAHAYLRRHRPSETEVELRRATERAVARVTGSSVLVDTSKRLLPLATAATLERPVTVVHLVRDPRAVAYSNLQRKTDPARHGALVVPPRPVWKSSVRWLVLNALIERSLADLGRRDGRPGSPGSPVGHVRLRYEDLVEDPVATLRPVVGAAADRLLDDSSARERHAVAGNPARFDRRGIVPDQRWRTGLGTGARVLAGTLTAPLLVRYHYHH